MRVRGHDVEVWAPQPRAWKWAPCASLKKWFGYIDQFVFFPCWAKRQIARLPQKTLFVFVDHALGPWVPLVADRAHVIHCHDFLAQRSARGDFRENKVSWSGRIYQSYIRKGYLKGQSFISISQSTQADLHAFFGRIPRVSKVVYNGYNADFRKLDRPEALEAIPEEFRKVLADGYILHVGGNQWYKNRLGVVSAYQRYADSISDPKPLVLVGPQPSQTLREAIEQVAPPGRIIVQCAIPFDRLRAFYNLASFLFFPSLEEGFGWPIAEAMACACPVLTTAKAPMTEVAGGAVRLLDRMPAESSQKDAWFMHAVEKWNEMFALQDSSRKALAEASLVQAQRFDSETVLDRYEAIYKKVQDVL